MKISIYTLAKDAVRLDFHLEAMLKHHLNFADEIVVCECYSNDNTFEVINALNDKKIKVIRTKWTQTESLLDIIDGARNACTGDWCIKLDLDEFIPEWVWPKLRRELEITSADILPISLINFYGNYRVYHSEPTKSGWPLVKWPIHRNTNEFELWGDSSNVKIKGKINEYGRADIPGFDVHHFGTVRDAARLREKWRTQAIRNQRHTGYYKDRSKIMALPSFIFNIFRHNWLDPEIVDHLKIYNGQIMEIVNNFPEEFIRDKMKVFNYLNKKI